MDKGLRQQPRDGRDARAWHRSCRLPPQGSADPAHPDPLHETLSVPPLFETMRARGFAPETAALDKGYDVTPVYEALEAADCRPIIPLRMTPAVKSEPEVCRAASMETGRSRVPTSSGSAPTGRCPTGECDPASRWVKADRRHPLVPRESKRWRDLYRGRAAVEREFGRLNNEYGLTPLRLRGRERVALHADLTMLARLSLALARARAVPLAA